MCLGLAKVNSILPQSRLQWTQETSADWFVYSCPPFLVLSLDSPSKQTICNASLSLLSSLGFPFHCLPLLQETKKEIGVCQSEKGGGTHWHLKSWTSLDACSYPHHPQPSKGCRIPPCNSWIYTNTWIFMYIQYLCSSLFLQRYWKVH